MKIVLLASVLKSGTVGLSSRPLSVEVATRVTKDLQQVTYCIASINKMWIEGW